VPLVLAEEEDAVVPGHTDAVDRQQRSVEDHEGLAAGYVEGLAKGWCDGGQDVDALADVAEHRCGADAEPVGQGGESRSDTAEIMPGRPPTIYHRWSRQVQHCGTPQFWRTLNSVKRDVAILQERIKR